MKTGKRLWSYLAQLFLERHILGQMCTEKEHTHFVFNNFLLKSCHLWDNVEKYCRAGQATDDNMAHAHFVLCNITLQTHTQVV